MYSRIVRSFFGLAVIGIVAVLYFFNKQDYSPDFNHKIEDVFINNSKGKNKNPLEAWKQDYELTKNPQTGRPEPEKLIPIQRELQKYLEASKGAPIAPGSSASNEWASLGPVKQGGRTRAVMFDPNDSEKKKVWAGGVTGGLWYNNDITDGDSEWVAVGDFWGSIGVSSIAHDPNDTKVFYVGTGEGFSSVTTTKGDGIWKTTDGGVTWKQLPKSQEFKYISDIAVRNEGGKSVLYVGVMGGYYKGTWEVTSGLYRSTDGGSSFTEKLGLPMGDRPRFRIGYSPACIRIARDNRLWVSTRRNPEAKGGGRIFYSDDGNSWTEAYNVSNSKSRVAIAVAPTDENYVYALVEENSKLSKVVYTSDRGKTWKQVKEPADADEGIANDDFTRGQAWYNLVVQVSPKDKNTIIAGGIDLFRSENNGRDWKQISRWNKSKRGLAGKPYSVVHADQHIIVFRPGYPKEVLFGNDGGVFYCSDLSVAHSSDVTESRDKGYITTQFYACDISPTKAQYIGGTQDNGSWWVDKHSSSPYDTKIAGGDGAACFVSKSLVGGEEYNIVSTTYNSYWCVYYNKSAKRWASRQLLSDSKSGYFINVAALDKNLDILYTYKSGGGTL